MKTVTKFFMLSLMSVFLMGAKCQKDDPASDHVKIDPSLRQRCPNLPVLEMTGMTMGDLLMRYKDLQVQYTECAIRHDCLIEAVDSKVEIRCPAIKRVETQEN